MKGLGWARTCCLQLKVPSGGMSKQVQGAGTLGQVPDAHAAVCMPAQSPLSMAVMSLHLSERMQVCARQDGQSTMSKHMHTCSRLQAKACKSHSERNMCKEGNMELHIGHSK